MFFGQQKVSLWIKLLRYGKVLHLIQWLSPWATLFVFFLLQKRGIGLVTILFPDRPRCEQWAKIIIRAAGQQIQPNHYAPSPTHGSQTCLPWPWTAMFFFFIYNQRPPFQNLPQFFFTRWLWNLLDRHQTKSASLSFWGFVRTRSVEAKAALMHAFESTPSHASCTNKCY